MMTSDQSTVQAKKIPLEVLFIDWHDGITKVYKEQVIQEETQPAEAEAEVQAKTEAEEGKDQPEIQIEQVEEKAEETKKPDVVESFAKKENAANKGVLNLSDCNLVHQLLARGFAIDGSVEHLMTSFTLIGAFNAEKHIPPCAIILNRNLSMDKGINKILKMIAAVSVEDPEKGGEFMTKHIPVGTLNAQNTISLFKFLTK